jgi:nitrite reductase (NADH) large subunit
MNPAVMAATRAGMGCGLCKSRVQDLVTFYCERYIDEDTVVHYSMPGVPMAKPELV